MPTRNGDGALRHGASGPNIHLPRVAAHPSHMESRPMDRSGGARETWSWAEYARLPDDGNRYEVVDGDVLVTPAPTPYHQKVILRLAVRLIDYVEPLGLGWVLQDVDLLLATGQFLRPDLVVVPTRMRDSLTDRGVEAPPALVVEVVSPSSRRIDCVLKPRRYLESGVPEYWAVDPRRGTVWMWDLERGAHAPREEKVRAIWRMEGAELDFAADVRELLVPL